MQNRLPFWLGLLAVVTPTSVFAYSVGGQSPRVPLEQNWQIQSSTQVTQTGPSLSMPGAPTTGWISSAVPNTVVGSLVSAGVYPDPYVGTNLRNLPGMTYPVGGNFSTINMATSSPFNTGWYYRTEFDVPARWTGQNVYLHLDGLNFRANVWVNGKTLISSDQLAGMYRLFELDVTRAVQTGRNALVIEVFPPTTNDLASGWVDWNPAPPDKNMGIHRPVYLTTSGPVAVRWTGVTPDLELPAMSKAALELRADLRNTTAARLTGKIRGTIGLVQDPAHHPDADGDLVAQFTYPVSLAANETRTFVLTPGEVPELALTQPAVWWPIHLGKQPLYTFKTEFVADDGSVSDSQQVRFGVRKITTDFTARGSRLFHINGQSILIRGGGWSPDMLLRSSATRERAELDYAADLGLNTIRMEGKLETDRFFDRADELGILLMPGWSCCDHWEKWSDWTAADLPIATASLTDQLRRIRNHPSVFVWLNGSDYHPTPTVEKAYLQVETDLGWTLPTLSHAGDDEVSTVTGHTGVKMTGPYEYVPPNYWMLDTNRRGGAFGFNTETSPGPAVPPIESLEQFIPAAHRWPIDSVWSFHAGNVDFVGHTYFTDALNARYGRAIGIEDYAAKSQLQSYETHRAMFEAYARNKYTSTGVIQWMLNNAWPSTMWHLYDSYLRPGGSYFGAKKANRLVHALYSYDDGSIAVVNHAYAPVTGLNLSVRVFNLDLSTKFNQSKTFDAGPDSSQRVIQIPTTLTGLTGTYFVRLDLTDATGTLIDTNVYWLSTTAETLKWDQLNWFYVPTAKYADFSALAQLSPTVVESSILSSVPGEDGRTRYRVHLKNSGTGMAFFTRLSLLRSDTNAEILPVIWEDNYVSLLPGETRDLSVEINSTLLGGAQPSLRVEPFNSARSLR